MGRAASVPTPWNICYVIQSINLSLVFWPVLQITASSYIHKVNCTCMTHAFTGVGAIEKRKTYGAWPRPWGGEVTVRRGQHRGTCSLATQCCRCSLNEQPSFKLPSNCLQIAFTSSSHRLQIASFLSLAVRTFGCDRLHTYMGLLTYGLADIDLTYWPAVSCAGRLPCAPSLSGTKRFASSDLADAALETQKAMPQKHTWNHLGWGLRVCSLCLSPRPCDKQSICQKHPCESSCAGDLFVFSPVSPSKQSRPPP